MGGERFIKGFSCRLFIGYLLDFVEPLQGNFSILKTLRKPYQLLYRAIELTDDILDSQHGTKCELAVQHKLGYKESNQDVLAFIDKQRTGLLILAEGKRSEIELEQLRLDMLPIPAEGLFSIVELDLLHPVNELHGGGIFLTGHRKTFIVQIPPAA